MSEAFLKLTVYASDGTELASVSITDLDVLGIPEHPLWSKALLLLRAELENPTPPPEVK
jgi:hypothetical protein